MARTAQALRSMARDAFHMHIGYCIAAWAHVDDALFNIFRDCLGPLDQSAVIYYRMPGLDTRLNTTDELVRVTLLPSWERPGTRDPRTRAWNTVFKSFLKLLKDRRRIAHHPVEEREIEGFVQPPADTPFHLWPLDSWFEIYVSRHERLRDKSAKLPPLREDDLVTHFTAVHELSSALNAFYQDVLTKPQSTSPPPKPPRPKAPGSKTDRPTKRRLRRRSSQA